MYKFSKILMALFIFAACAQPNQEQYASILSGVPWYTSDGKNVSAHGACIVHESDTFYLFGEYKNNHSNRFEGFSCYASTDLKNWTFKGLALPPNKSGRLSGEHCIGERPKVMKCPATGEFIMYMHADSNGYRNPAVEYAVAKHIAGPYQYKGALLFNGQPIRRWDMGTFQDEDGTGYLLLHHGDIYQLSDDYKSVKAQVLKHDPVLRTESPAMLKNNGTYYWIGSGLTGWERNDNLYFTAKNLAGPWTRRGTIAPEGTLTWNSQSTFVLPVEGNKTTTYMYMGDRWSFPKQQATATYVWQPLVFNGDEISMPRYLESWSMDLTTGEWASTPLNPRYEVDFKNPDIRYTGVWQEKTLGNSTSMRADGKEDVIRIPFHGKRIAWRGVASIDCGYALVEIKNAQGQSVHKTWVDMYANKTAEGMQYMSPVMPKGDYTLHISPTQSHWYWTEKSGKQWGSKGTFVSFTKAMVY